MAKSIKYKVKELEIHSDKRGWLVEMLKQNELKENINQVYVATIKPNFTRGNHYHLKRKEWFFIVNGKANVYLQDIETKEKICLKISSRKPRMITIFPKVAHAVKNTGKETIYLISAQNDIYNTKKPETFTHQLNQKIC